MEAVEIRSTLSASHPIDTRPSAIFLMGPTASGKTAVALELAEHYGFELVSVDSALVYRGMDIGSAKPDRAELARVPHHLIDIREPNQVYSAADFCGDALAAMADITARGKTPLLVGGTSLYFRALQQGLSALPSADAETRTRLQEEVVRLGLDALHERLCTLDPEAGARIKPGDSQRIQRALEVIALTGQTLSSQLDAERTPFAYRVLKLALVPDRAVLHARIEQRVDAMLAQGLLAEVAALRLRGDLEPGLPSMRSVGYRQAWQHLDGSLDAAEFRDRAVFATRQLAKRQMTWLRSELDGRWFDPLDAKRRVELREAVGAFLGTA